jgi:hypothetical protein
VPPRARVAVNATVAETIVTAARRRAVETAPGLTRR